MSRTITLDRPHRFHVGSTIKHRDCDTDYPGAIVAAHTLRVVTTTDEDGSMIDIAYPTYKIVDGSDGEVYDDILCTDDLVLVETDDEEWEHDVGEMIKAQIEQLWNEYEEESEHEGTPTSVKDFGLYLQLVEKRS